jgi:hypothetical protein
VDPFYQVWFHPLWKEALKGIQLSNYKNLPFYPSPSLNCTSSNGTVPVSNLNQEDTMHRYNSEIFQTIGNLGNISESQRVAKMREHFNKLEKISVKSVKSTKYAICAIIEVTNRLGSISMTLSNSNIYVSAIDKARQYHQKHTLQNSSPLKYLKGKVKNASDDNLFAKSAPKKRRSNCKVCCDQFKEPPAIYPTYRSNSSKCPRNKNAPSSFINPILSPTKT